MKAKYEHEQIRDRLKVALFKAHTVNTTKRSRQELLDFLRDDSERGPNQKEVVAILKSVWRVRSEL